MRRRILLAAVVLSLHGVAGANPAADDQVQRMLYLVSPDAAGGRGGKGIYVFDINRGHQLVRKIDLPLKGVRGVCGCVKSGRLWIAHGDTTVLCLDLTTDKVLWEKTYPRKDGCDRICCTPDGMKIYVPSGAWSGSTEWKILDGQSGNEVGRFRPHKSGGGHNALVSLDGTRLFCASKSNNFLAVVDTATDRVVGEVGPVGGGIHPFTVTADASRCFLNTGRSGVGFEVGDVRTGKIVHQVKVPGLEKEKRLCHGIGLSPDEKEVWLNDRGTVHVFDITGPAPRFVETLKLTAPGHGWTTFSIDGRFGYPDSGDVFDRRTHKAVARLTDGAGKEVASSKMIEIHFQGGKVIRVGDQFGVGRRRGRAVSTALRTTAERTNFEATSRHDEVAGFCRELAKASPRVHVAELGVSHEGRKLPLVIVADPPVATAAEAAKSGKLVVLAMGNIHAGEVDGKEALLMLMRDVALADDRTLLENLVFLFVPNFNADGGDRLAKTNRPWQNGPPEVGIRANAQGFDLNRDYVKLESPEVCALVRLFNEWDPAIVIDTHTTNGSYHNFAITYDAPRHPACDRRLVDFTRDALLPDVGARLKKHGGQLSGFYGNFAKGKTVWESYPAQPRFGTQYVGLRNRIGILCESYVYAPYRTRVLASRDFVQSCFEYAAENTDTVRKLLKDASAPRAKVALRHRTAACDKQVTVPGIEGGKTAPPGKVKDYAVTYLGKCEATLEITRPYAYVIPAEYKTAIATLGRHGIAAQPLKRDVETMVEVYRIGKVTRASRAFQGHELVSVETQVRIEQGKLPAGSVVIRTDQPLGTLAAFLLEPGSEDGLCTWNFFDTAVREGADYPVLRLRGELPQ